MLFYTVYCKQNSCPPPLYRCSLILLTNKRTPSYVYTMFKDNQSEGESSIKVTHWLGNLAVHKYMVQTIDVTLVTFALNLKTDPPLVIHLCSHY